MSAELRLKKLRGSGGFVMARVTDEQQSKGNLGGPDLFLAPIGRLEPEKISKTRTNENIKFRTNSTRVAFEATLSSALISRMNRKWTNSRSKVDHDSPENLDNLDHPSVFH